MAKNSEATLLLRIKSAGESVLSKTKSALSDIRTWAAAAFAALTSGAAVMAFREAEEATNRLNQSLVNQGLYTSKLSKEYQDMAAELQTKTLYEDDAIKSAQASMQSYLGQTKISKELMTATLNLAAAKKMDLASAAEMVAKSIGTGTNALARQGVELDASASKSEKLEKVVSILNSRYAGFAEEQGKGLGSLTIAKNAIGELLEAVGERLAPFLTAAAQAVTRFATSISNNEQVWFWFELLLQTIAKVAAGLKFQFVTLGDVLVNIFTAIGAALNKVVHGDLMGAVEEIGKGFDRTFTDVETNYSRFTSELESIDDIYVKAKWAKQEEDVRRTADSEKRKSDIEKNAAIDKESFFKTMDDKEIARLLTQEELKGDVRLYWLNRIIDAEKDHTAKMNLEREKRRYIEDKEEKHRTDSRSRVNSVLRSLGIQRTEEFRTMLDDMSQLQNSKSKIMVGVGKAAAIANITIKTAEAAMGAHAALNGIPYVGPALAIPAAGLVIAYGAERAASVAGIQLAEGGIVKATPGGVHAIIGEGGRDEAVIPLDGNGSPLMGMQVNFHIVGGILGDRQQAREFAMAFDQELFRLRQSNESMAFDRGVI